jgi:hypothetical protein
LVIVTIAVPRAAHAASTAMRDISRGSHDADHDLPTATTTSTTVSPINHPVSAFRRGVAPRLGSPRRRSAPCAGESVQPQLPHQARPHSSSLRATSCLSVQPSSSSTWTAGLGGILTPYRDTSVTQDVGKQAEAMRKDE